MDRNNTEMCLVCCSKALKISKDKECNDLLYKNLFVIFLFKNILQISDNLLVEYLKEFGNPINWFRLCEQCTQLTSKALDLHCEIVKLDRELWSVQKIIVDKTKQSSLKSVDTCQTASIWGRTRNFVKNSKFYSGCLPINPFTKGDKLATANQHFSREIFKAAQIKDEPLNSDIHSDVEEPDHLDFWGDDSPEDLSEDNEDIRSKVKNVKAPFNDIKQSPRKPRIIVHGKVQCYHCDKLFSNDYNCQRHEKQKHAGMPAPINGNGEKDDQDINTLVEDELSLLPEVDNDAKDKNEGKESSEEEEDKDDVQNKMLKALKKLKLKRSSTGSRKNEENSFACRVCGKVYPSRYMTQRHERAFIKKKRCAKMYKCELCERKFVSRGCFQWHRWEKHGLSSFSGKVEKKRYSCKICNKGFPTRSRLERHGNYHKRLEMRKMKMEKKAIAMKLDDQAKRSAEGKLEWIDGKVKCGKCEKAFLNVNSLRNHERVKHRNTLEQFICDLCGKVWECSRYFELHRKRCANLKVESRSRISERREGYGKILPDGRRIRGQKYEAVDGKLKCKSCDKLFRSVAGMYKHEQEKHPKNPGSFICTHCGMTFNSLEYLRVHTERKHWMRLDGTKYIPPWVAKKINKEKETVQGNMDACKSTPNENQTLQIN